jgi:hypothetical protein
MLIQLPYRYSYKGVFLKIDKTISKYGYGIMFGIYNFFISEIDIEKLSNDNILKVIKLCIEITEISSHYDIKITF